MKGPLDSFENGVDAPSSSLSCKGCFSPSHLLSLAQALAREDRIRGERLIAHYFPPGVRAVPTMAFGREDWVKYIGEIGEEPLLLHLTGFLSGKSSFQEASLLIYTKREIAHRFAPTDTAPYPRTPKNGKI